MPGFAQEYASALYSLSREENLDPEILGEVRELKALFDGHPELVRLLSDPVISKSERQESADRIFGGRIHPYLMNLIRLTVKNGRIGSIKEILSGYIDLWYRYSGIAVAEVVSAVPLSEDQKSRLHRALESKFGGNVEMRLSVDPALIGGLKVTVGDNMADNTVRRKIDGIERHLKQTVI
ncbi:MAG: ATP synthase F1 subunit delta [Clostridia bacterium]|nr:ATP synthase F1 subunit delta [Clostridia bacterium]